MPVRSHEPDDLDAVALPESAEATSGSVGIWINDPARTV